VRSKVADSFWNELLDGLLTALLEDDIPAVRMGACDCVSFLGKDSYATMPTPKRIVCQTLVLGLTLDSMQTVKAAASRALGVLVLYPELRDDIMFVMDVATHLVDVIAEKAVLTRIRASWALGNLADSLVVRRELVPEPDQVPTNLLTQLLEAALKSAKDSDKVRPNAMRSLGGLGRIVGADFIATPKGPAMVSAIAAELVTNLTIGAVKVRWNAAYGARFSTEIYTRGCHWIPRMFA
jgi:hypothetical protein